MSIINDFKARYKRVLQNMSLKNQVRFSVMSLFSVKVHAPPPVSVQFSFVTVYSDRPNFGLLYLNAIKCTSKLMFLHVTSFTACL